MLHGPRRRCLDRGNGDDADQGEEGQLRELLLQVQPALRAERRRAVRDLSPRQPGGPAAAAPDAPELPRRLAHPADVCISLGAGAGVASRIAFRRAIHSLPGRSVRPWARIEQNTTSAAMWKIRSPWAIGSDRTSSEKVIVATPFGPNQAMNAFVAVSVRVPASATQIATGRATSSVTTTIATVAQPSSNRPWNVSSDPNTTKTPSFTTSLMSSPRAAT